MMCTTLTSPLLGRSFGTAKGYVLPQHAVENYQHQVCYRYNGPFRSAARGQLLEAHLED
jgi:hypothetical protein